jgi:hypothetical protein
VLLQTLPVGSIGIGNGICVVLAHMHPHDLTRLSESRVYRTTQAQLGILDGHCSAKWNLGSARSGDSHD